MPQEKRIKMLLKLLSFKGTSREIYCFHETSGKVKRKLETSNKISNYVAENCITKWKISKKQKNYRDRVFEHFSLD